MARYWPSSFFAVLSQLKSLSTKLSSLKPSVDGLWLAAHSVTSKPSNVNHMTLMHWPTRQLIRKEEIRPLFSLWNKGHWGLVLYSLTEPQTYQSFMSVTDFITRLSMNLKE